ncbi:MAG: RlmE family RNA methyltransferase [Candidatus Berkiella sp.]
MVSRTKHGKSWIERHLNDPYVKKAQQQGYRSRASYKILEIQEQDKLFRQGMSIVDLGAAPGGWSQVLAKIIGAKGKLIALDILEMEPISGVTMLQGDFTEQATLDALEAEVKGQPIDWVVSDMSPNISGIIDVDQPRVMELAELAFEFAKDHLKSGGGLLFKIFQGEGFDLFIRTVRKHFKQVNIRKPDASRSASRELYVLARGYYNNSM